MKIIQLCESIHKQYSELDPNWDESAWEKSIEDNETKLLEK
jgi:hypothetical protein